MPVELLKLILNNSQEVSSVLGVDLQIRIPRSVVAHVTYLSVQLTAERARKWCLERNVARPHKMGCTDRLLGPTACEFKELDQIPRMRTERLDQRVQDARAEPKHAAILKGGKCEAQHVDF